jgi:hypothetical protein
MKLACTLRLIEETFSAAAFAEENEQETALALLGTKEAENSMFCACSASQEHCLCTLHSAA